MTATADSGKHRSKKRQISGAGPELLAAPAKGTGVSRVDIEITGVVQGVGFRPFVFREAVSRGLSGRVLNSAAGVRINVEGPAARVDSFIRALEKLPPPRAVIAGVKVVAAEPAGYEGFRISASDGGGGPEGLVGADSCTCDDCQAELFDAGDRRYRYPFINCTNCGPRFTIIAGLPYDRNLTSMNEFEMCPACRDEYDDPANRRFHAEPNACPDCGPSLWLTSPDGSPIAAADPVREAALALAAGKIVALKSLGGFQLACLAGSAPAVQLLRKRKHRPDKPFAVMMPSLAEAALTCRISPAAERLLVSPERPIVLLDRTGGGVAGEVAPGLDRLGVMLPYTPLHFLLMDETGAPLVMTSGNVTGEPICGSNEEALARLASVADLFLLHNRDILSTYDDSVMALDDRDLPMMIRRARGYAPLPLRLLPPAARRASSPRPEQPGLPHAPRPARPRRPEPLLAAGGDLKSSFCLTRGEEAFVSQHIGGLENVATAVHYQRTAKLYETLFRTRAERFVCDGHPGYVSTAYARGRGLESGKTVLAVQHHRAHIASCLAEHGVSGPAVGVALDGTGLGDDGAIWGGEFFTGSLSGGFKRTAHLTYFPLPGGDACVRDPWRTALALARTFAPARTDFIARRLGVSRSKEELIIKQMETGLNCFATSSCGRLFDAVAAIALLRSTVTYEAQAPMELETVARKELESGAHPAGGYHFLLQKDRMPWQVNPAPAIAAMIDDIAAGVAAGVVALRFHLGLAAAIVATCLDAAELCGSVMVASSGGVWQNRLLLAFVDRGLTEQGLKPLYQRQLPAGDGGLSFGQAALALNMKPDQKTGYINGGGSQVNLQKNSPSAGPDGGL